MSQQGQIVPIEGRKLVLGFDAGCMTCSGLARRIEEEVGERIEVLSLRDPKVEAWRKTALGKDAPWAPTLIAVKGLKVRAWTGWQMGVQLGRSLGLVASWRMMQLLGEVGTTPKIERSSVLERLPDRAAEAVVGMSRGQFLKGVGGAAVAISMFSGVGPFARPAEALELWQGPNFTGFRQMYGSELQAAARKCANQHCCEWAAGPGYAPAMQSGLTVASADDAVASSNGVHARAAMYRMKNGNRMISITVDLQGEKLLHFREYEQRRNGVKSVVTRWGVGPGLERLWAERQVVNDQNYGTDPSAPSLQAACPQTCDGFTGSRQFQDCSSFDLACLGELAVAAYGCSECNTKCRDVRSRSDAIKCGACRLILCGSIVLNNCCRQYCDYCISCALGGQVFF